MNDLQAVLRNNIQTLYAATEINEILFAMYDTISLAINIKADKLTVKPLQVLCLDKGENIIYEFPSELTEVRRISNIHVFDLIMSRDSVVRDHFKLDTRDDMEVTYIIT